MSRSLAGKRVLITRPADRAAALAALVRAAGAEPVLWPALGIDDPADFGPFDRVAGSLSHFDLAIFVSPTAAARALARIEKLGHTWPSGLAVAAIGEGTRRELAERGLDRAIVPVGRADSEALLALPAFGEVRDKRVVIFRGSGGRELLATVLAERGAAVEYAECYRRVRTAVPQLPPSWAAQPLHAVTVSSSEGLASTAETLGRFRPDWKRESVLFVPHPRIGEDAIRLGAREIVVAGPGDEEIAARLVAYFRDAR